MLWDHMEANLLQCEIYPSKLRQKLFTWQCIKTSMLLGQKNSKQTYKSNNYLMTGSIHVLRRPCSFVFMFYHNEVNFVCSRMRKFKTSFTFHKSLLLSLSCRWNEEFKQIWFILLPQLNEASHHHPYLLTSSSSSCRNNQKFYWWFLCCYRVKPTIWKKTNS